MVPPSRHLVETCSRTSSRSVALMDISHSYESRDNSATLEGKDDELSWMKHEKSHSSSIRRRFPTVESIKELTRLNDRRLHDVAAAGASNMNWSKLDMELVAASICGKHGRVWARKQLSQCSADTKKNAMKLYTRVTIRDHRHQTRWGPKGFAVLAQGVLPCTVQELRLVFQVASTKHFCERMRCIHRREFVKGEILRTITIQQEPENPTRAFENRELTVKTVTFEKRAPYAFSKHESWCFLELLQPRDRAKEEQSGRRTASSTASALGTTSAPAFTRTLVSIAPSRVSRHTARQSQARSVPHVPHVVINYMFEEDPTGRSTRVVFHGEYFPPDGYDTIKRAGHERRLARLWILRLATSCHRFVSIVRRRRLGMQVIVSSTRFSLDTMAHFPRCACCHGSFSILLKRTRKRLCCLCGFLVCTKCAHVQEREHRARGDTFPQIQHVRACKRCLLRVDQARYSAVTEEDLRPARVIADVPSPSDCAISTSDASLSSSGQCHMFQTRSASLNDLLLDMLANASTGGPAQRRHKAFVVNVMKDLVHEERARRRAIAVKISADRRENELPLLGDDKKESEDGEDDQDADDMERFQDMWDEGPGWRDEFPLANTDSRSYHIEFPDNEMEPLVPPIPSDEHKRLELIHEQQLTSLGNVPELDIICVLAAKELKCAMSMITIVGETQLHVLASTHPAIPRGQSFAREQGFCAQTILDHKPLVSRHVQADVRFSAIAGVRRLNINFYCGFPFLGSDGKTVIGSVCCADPQARNLTQSQYVAMSSLARTASRVVQRAVNERVVRENSRAKATMNK